MLLHVLETKKVGKLFDAQPYFFCYFQFTFGNTFLV